MTQQTDSTVDTISVNEVAQLLLDLLASGLKRPWGAPSDETLFARAYQRQLCRIPAGSIRAVVLELCASEEEELPTAGQLAVKAKLHAARAAVAEAREKPIEGYFAVVIDAAGPRARLMPAHEAAAKGYAPVAELTCPHEGCHCPAVSCWVPTSYERRQDRGGPPTPISATAPAELPTQQMLVWLWECESNRVGARLHADAR